MSKTTNLPPLGQRLRELREGAGLSQAELARRAGVAQSILSYTEAGQRSVSWDTACQLADALGVSLDELRGTEQRTRK